jgi:hypothetical protein
MKFDILNKFYNLFFVITLLCGVMIVGFTIYKPIVSLLQQTHPYLSWSDWVVADAKELANGNLIYGNPSERYVGLLYTPFYTFIFAILLKLKWWEGWGAVISFFSFCTTCFCLAICTGKIWSLTNTTGRILDFLARVAIWIVLMWFCMSAIHVNGILEARPEQFAWMWVMLAIASLSKRFIDNHFLLSNELIATFLFLTLAFFSKQTTAPLSFVIALIIFAHYLCNRKTNETHKAFGKLFLVTLPSIVLTVITFGILQWKSNGFFLDLIVGVPFRHARLMSIKQGAEIILSLAIPAILFFGICFVSFIQSRAYSHRKFFWYVVIFVSVLVAQIISGSTAIAKQGGDSNQAVGLVLLFSALSALLLGLASKDRKKIVLFFLLVVAVFVKVGVATPVIKQKFTGVPGNSIVFSAIPHELTNANDLGLRVFDMYSYPSTGVLKDSNQNPGFVFHELVSAGYSFRSIISGLLDGKFDLANKIDAPNLGLYASAYGQRDESVAWKINWILDEAFKPSNLVVSGGHYRQPRSDIQKFKWIEGCFSPWRANETRLIQVGGIHAWCLDKSGSLELKKYTDGPTIFAIYSTESVELQLFFSVKNKIKSCPNLTQNRAFIPPPLPHRKGSKFVCEYHIYPSNANKLLQAKIVVPTPGFDSLSIKDKKLVIFSPHPGDPILKVTRNGTIN